MAQDKKIPEHLLDQISQLFQYYGFKSLSMDDLSKELRISKKTLYQFANNKLDVIEQSISAQLKKHQEAPINADFEILFDHLVTQLSLFSTSSIEDLKIFYPNAFELYSTFRYGNLIQLVNNYFEQFKEKLYLDNFETNFLSEQIPNWIELILHNRTSEADQKTNELAQLKQFLAKSLIKPSGS